jgi:hypothetical protein
MGVKMGPELMECGERGQKMIRGGRRQKNGKLKFSAE